MWSIIYIMIVCPARFQGHGKRIIIDIVSILMISSNPDVGV